MSSPILYRVSVEPSHENPDGFLYVWAITGTDAERRAESEGYQVQADRHYSTAQVQPIGSADEHNGWPNYETWAVYNWLSSTERAWNHVIELSEMSTDRFELANRLRDLYESQAHNLLDQVNESASVWSDLLIHAVQRVDFDRIARSVFSEREDEPSPTA